MTRIACYIQRSHSGASIVGIRLVAPGFDRLWTPSPTSGSGSGTSGTGEGGNAGAMSMVGGQTSVSTIHAAADWIAENLSALNTRELDTICVDPDGSVCTWLSAPSPEPKVIAATMAQLSLTDSDAASGAAGRLAMLSSPDPATALSENSIQALALAEPPSPVGGDGAAPKPARRKGGKTVARAPSSRFALLSIPDSPIRVLVDALDERSIQVGKVISLWHAVASEFDPAARAMPGFNADHRSGTSARSLVSGSEVPSAILLLDPIGRLVWAWSLGGKLIAGGTMRLKRVAIRRETEPNDPFAQTNSDDPLLTGPSGLPASGAEHAEYDERFECSTPEVGRLVLDWLSWGAQLGQAPQRVVCLGPQTVAGTIGSIVLRRPGSAANVTPDPTHADPAPGFAEALAGAWPGATYDFLEHDDPVGLAMQRLTSEAVRGNTDNAASASTRSGKTLTDPRRELTALSARPGRATRSLYRWAALAVLAAAVVVIGLGYQLHRSAARSTVAIAAAATKQKEAVDSVATLLPGIAASRNPLADLNARIAEVRKQAEATNPPQPMIPELVRLLTAFTEVRDKLPEEKQNELRITDISLNPVTATCRLQVPDTITGPNIEVALSTMPGKIRWIGNTPRGSGQFLLQGSPATSGSAGNNAGAPKPGATATGGARP